MSSIDELYHRCRWCRNFYNDKCTIADEVFEISNIKEEIEDAIDDGGLAEAIRETLHSHLTALTYASDDKAATEEEIDKIIGEIEVAVKNLSVDCEGLAIKEPSTNDHYCKRFE